MFKSLSNISKVSNREEGQGLVEYALILVLVSVVVIVVLSMVGPGVGNIFSQVTTALNGSAAGETVENGGGCQPAGSGDPRYVLVDGNGGIPAGDRMFSDSDCTSNAGIIDFDSVKIAGGAGVSAAKSKCQAVFGKNLRYTGTGTPEENSEIWGGSGYWYCTP